MRQAIGRHLTAIVRPEQAGQRGLPRVDLLVMTFAAGGGVLLVLADIFQRWITSSRHPMLDIDGHANIETWFHTTILAVAAVFALAAAFTFFDNRRRALWLVAGAGVAFFSLDKSVSLHEIVGAHEVSWFSLPESAGSIAWEITWAPLILVTTAALVLCVWEASTTTKFWIGVAILGGVGKIGLEALTFPLIHSGVTSERGWLYGVEVNIEESIQLMGFAAVCAAFGQYFVDRVFALARGETEAEHTVEFEPAIAIRESAPMRALERLVASRPRVLANHSRVSRPS